ncbi:hypothetical protein FRUB_03602 [Fimbriiglobus ruber]|uniref:Uncharacterized protein n=1 Tax=Fimbriiglobus ruber TaxID=1908690 RepID=A0A225DSG0_9BACT|nr:hypothetical protein FRUB_03602 [Fimbriiglobus ruber]
MNCAGFPVATRRTAGIAFENSAPPAAGKERLPPSPPAPGVVERGFPGGRTRAIPPPRNVSKPKSVFLSLPPRSSPVCPDFLTGIRISGLRTQPF